MSKYSIMQFLAELSFKDTNFILSLSLKTQSNSVQRNEYE